MKIYTKLNKLNIMRALVLVAIVALSGVYLLQVSYAATGSGSLSFSPASSSVTVGNQLVVTLQENSGSIQAVGTDAYIAYDSSLLDFVSATPGTAFSIQPTPTASGGTLHLVDGGMSPVTGTNNVATITFNAKAAGTATLSFGNQSYISPFDNTNTINLTNTNGSYTLNATSTGGGGTTGGGGGGTTGGGSSGGSTTPTPTPTPAPKAPSTSGKSTSVNISANSTGTPITVPNGASAQANQPVTVQPTTQQTQGVKSVQYYLDGKLVDTETKPPFTYHIDTTTLQNGAHTLVTKTNYSNGTSQSSTQHLVVTDGYKKPAPLADWILPPLIIVLIGVAIIMYSHLLRQYFGHVFHAPAAATGGMNVHIGGGPQPVTSKPDHDIVGVKPSTVVAPGSAPPPAATPEIKAHPTIPPPSSVVAPSAPEKQDEDDDQTI